ncbi:oligopeptide/dipeptide ABC transporter ATP-binding protein [Nocardioides deserti]|uniref:ABC transporter ATP-binding protein n=1 Tax=Nocardioides deserti TaxID=1588644 RepID=A0ABR6U5R1_9ACTN|nr:ABC transporter ATP-binding protein [Nocardioides deserti]MBC2959304.1 ABC transporter ATP-binding protein [Nocardioides deserti]GGO68096.1 dipeptide/oligopeptide/nickel ABC transporter ATP-binding protein [Nocardioides deserti]
MNETVAELRDVHVVHRISGGRLFERQRVHALTGADLAIARGETVGIVGESGCGKSTLAKVLVGLQRPTSGQVLVADTDVWTMSPAQRREHIGAGVGMVFQDPSTSLNRRMAIRRILRDPLDVHRRGTVAQREERVRELMALVGLPRSVADALPSQLSGGQRQRVSIARALALEPGLLIADEPTSALDVSVRAQILNLLMDLQDRLDLAMVFVSHDIQTVKRVSDRIVTMYLGRIVEQAPARVMPEGAAHPYTRALFSATPGLLSPLDPIPLVGPVPSATRPPSGCPFRTRCWRADDLCAETMPPFGTGASGTTHVLRCHHPVPSGTSDAELVDMARRATHTPTPLHVEEHA